MVEKIYDWQRVWCYLRYEWHLSEEQILSLRGMMLRNGTGSRVCSTSSNGIYKELRVTLVNVTNESVPYFNVIIDEISR